MLPSVPTLTLSILPFLYTPSPPPYLLPGSHPVRARCRPLNPLQEQDLKIQLDEWLAGGVIEPSVSPWASALVPCKKKGTGRLRWSIDFRSINDRTIKDSYPLPCIETIINCAILKINNEII